MSRIPKTLSTRSSARYWIYVRIACNLSSFLLKGFIFLLILYDWIPYEFLKLRQLLYMSQKFGWNADQIYLDMFWWLGCLFIWVKKKWGCFSLDWVVRCCKLWWELVKMIYKFIGCCYLMSNLAELIQGEGNQQNNIFECVLVGLHSLSVFI